MILQQTEVLRRVAALGANSPSVEELETLRQLGKVGEMRRKIQDHATAIATLLTEKAGQEDVDDALAKATRSAARADQVRLKLLVCAASVPIDQLCYNAPVLVWLSSHR